MNITPWTIYWITRLNYIENVSCFIAILSGIILIPLICVLVAMKSDDRDERDSSFRIPYKAAKILACVFLVMLNLAIFVPTTKEMAAIVVVPEIVNSEKMQNIGDEFYNLALDWMKELHPENVNKEKTK